MRNWLPNNSYNKKLELNNFDAAVKVFIVRATEIFDMAYIDSLIQVHRRT